MIVEAPRSSHEKKQESNSTPWLIPSGTPEHKELVEKIRAPMDKRLKEIADGANEQWQALRGQPPRED